MVILLYIFHSLHSDLEIDKVNYDLSQGHESIYLNNNTLKIPLNIRYQTNLLLLVILTTVLTISIMLEYQTFFLASAFFDPAKKEFPAHDAGQAKVSVSGLSLDIKQSTTSMKT